MRFLLLFLLSACIAACASTTRANLQTDLDQGLISQPTATTVDAAGFRQWADDFTTRAIATGYDPATTRLVMQSVQFQPKVIPLDKKQPESQLTLQQYLDKTITADRIARGRAKLADNYSTLNAVAQQTGVPANVLVALWGKETSYGAVMGGYPIGDALATLAYEGRRRAFFEKELGNFIQIVQQVGRDPKTLQGSWAGAMGQCQFMPSSYLKYAADGNGDGVADIWTSLPDVFTSSANFLRQVGWHPNEPVAQKVSIATPIDPSIVGRDKAPRSIAQWQQLGVQNIDNLVDLPARLYAPDGLDGPAYMIYANFDVLLRWNNSGYFATGVATLANNLN